MIGRTNSRDAIFFELVRTGLIGIIAFSLVSPFSNTVFAQGSADIMHRRHHADKQDLSVEVFKATLINIRKNDWSKVGKEVERLQGRLREYNGLFQVDLNTPLRKAIKEKKAKKLLKLLAQEVFLSMKLQFHQMIETEIDDYMRTEASLKIAELAYTEILAGNVKRKNPEADLRVKEAFLDAEIALGNPGINPLLPQTPSDLKAFKKAAKKIEEAIEGVYTYFNEVKG